ncbi:uncharacterized protein DUF4390 [Desulfosoma caldarium]|uniref:Uncharacterized protein DUF4390 n=2 Tax=Desulfosoma caldarium TaxID=610254 RepID=A0A3N1VFZ8_9BACT|nr:uncharacterized protein DUF4390 [Desulfosoma caldarium]
MRKAFFFAQCLWLMMVAVSDPAWARNRADIMNLKVYPDPPSLKISFRIDNCFNEDMEQAVQSGVPTTFRIHLVVDKAGLPWIRERLLQATVERTIRYDTLHEQYFVSRAEDPSSWLSTKRWEEAKAWMSEVRGLPVMALWRLVPDQTYLIQVKAELSKAQVPSILRYIFFFVSLWDFETPWVTAAYTHAPTR